MDIRLKNKKKLHKLKKIRKLLRKLRKHGDADSIKTYLAFVDKKMKELGIKEATVHSQGRKIFNKFYMFRAKGENYFKSNIFFSNIKDSDDIMFGGRGKDFMYARSGNDVLRGGRNSDFYFINGETDTGTVVIEEFHSRHRAGDDKIDEVHLKVKKGYQANFDYSDGKYVVFQVGGKTVKILNNGATETLVFKDSTGKTIYYKWENGKYVLDPSKNNSLTSHSVKTKLSESSRLSPAKSLSQLV